METSEIELIQLSFADVKPISEQAAELFYGRLFDTAPSVKPLFKSDMTEQGRKLMGTVAYLNDLPSILPAASGPFREFPNQWPRAALSRQIFKRMLMGRHPRMPASLSNPDEFAHIIAYIKTLAKPEGSR